MGKSEDESNSNVCWHSLSPFMHQVSGHTGIFKLTCDKICKPFSCREHDFYHYLPEVLRSFTPAFLGVVDVKYEEDSGGFLILKVNIASIDQSNNSSDATTDINCRIRRQKNGALNLVFKDDSHEVFQNLSTLNNHSYLSNPWGLKCQSSHINRMVKHANSNHKFLVLENLVQNLSYPCVLDIKLGTRQHGDDAPEEKKKSQTFKCQKSTSATLGMRICGMQFYDPVEKLYRCIDKYHGRSFNDENLKTELLRFVGTRREELSSVFIIKLEALQRTLMTMGEGFRFWSSSLLLLYDGKNLSDKCSFSEEDIDVRMIDFEHSTALGFKKDLPYNGLDEGYMLGLRNLISTLKELRDTY